MQPSARAAGPKPALLFVDDEPLILEGLARAFYACRKRWSVRIREQLISPAIVDA